MRNEHYVLAADLVLLLHAAFVFFVLVGELLILFGWWRRWRWPRNRVFRLAHTGAIALVVLESWFGIVCPLTTWESALRVFAGQSHYEVGFIAYWVDAAPTWVFALLYTGFGAIVLASFVLYPPHGNVGWKWRSKNAE